MRSTLPKPVFFGLFCIALLAGKPVAAQTVTLSASNMPVEKFLSLVEAQTGYAFIYSSDLKKSIGNVTISVKNEKLESFLRIWLVHRPVGYYLQDNYIVLFPLGAAIKRRAIKGRVITPAGEPAAGLTVAIKKSGLSTSTNDRGDFEFGTAVPNSILVISGAEVQTTEKEVGEEDLVIVVSPSINALDEAVVMAYGKTTRRYSTATIGRVNADQLQKQVVSNPLAALSGRVAGLQVLPQSGMAGSMFTVRVRGQNSIANGNQPLIVIDGVPYPSTTLNHLPAAGVFGSPLANLNPSDIESMEVLKDAAATAIYGSRGANGVILVTLKKAAPGKLSVRIRTQLGTGMPTRRIPLLSTSDYLRMRQEAFYNDGSYPPALLAPDIFRWDSTRYTNWQDELIGHTMMHSATRVELSAGNSNTQYLVRLSHQHESTLLSQRSFGERKISLFTQLSYSSPNRKMRLSAQTNLLFNKTLLPQTDMSAYIYLPPNAPALYTATGELNWADNTWTNPMAHLLKRYQTANTGWLSGLDISCRPLPGLALNLSAGYNLLRVSDRHTTPMSSFNPAMALLANASFGTGILHTLIMEPRVVYKKLRPKWQMEILAGATVQQTDQQGILKTGSGYTSDEQLRNFGYASLVTSSSQRHTRYRYAGVFARWDADWKKKYLFSFTARKDGSSRYGPANRFAGFASAAAAWIFSEEKWMKPLRLLSHGKIKFSHGSSGNDQVGDYQFYDSYAAAGNPYLGTTPLVPIRADNPHFSWEKVRKRELALDLGFFKNRVLLNTRYYQHTSDNQLMHNLLPPSTGFAGIAANLPAKLRNSGLELELSATFLKRKEFSWDASFNITFPQNRLLRFDQLGLSAYAGKLVVGKALSTDRRYGFEGVNERTGLYQFTDFNRDGLINAHDRQVFVFTGERFFGGMNQSIRWKRWSIDLFLHFVSQPNAPGYKAYLASPGAYGNQPDKVMGRWQHAGDPAMIQRFSNSNEPALAAYYRYQQSDAAYSNASFLRLRNLYVSYDFSGRIFQSSRIKKCVAFMQGQNIVTVTGYDGLDPETKWMFPLSKMFACGFELDF